jgi:ABC-type xylose transport system substrate-binding protein
MCCNGHDPQRAELAMVLLPSFCCMFHFVYSHPAVLCGSAAHAQSVAFINPGKSDEIYWVTATQAMQAVAHSLGMVFEVQYAEREPPKTFAIAREMVSRATGKRPKYVVITDDSAVADQLVKIIDSAGVKSFLAYSSRDELLLSEASRWARRSSRA